MATDDDDDDVISVLRTFLEREVAGELDRAHRAQLPSVAEGRWK